MGGVRHSEIHMDRCNYRNSLDFVEAGFKACWLNTRDLVKGTKVLLDNSLHALALSTSVLALEELGKLFCVHGLLFARTARIHRAGPWDSQGRTETNS